MFYNIYKKFAHITTKINFGGIMKEFVFVKKNKIYRQSLYYMLIAILIFQGVLFILNLALIRSNSNWFSVVFNTVFLSVFSFIIYKHIMPKYKYKVEKAEYKWFKIKNDIIIVKFNDGIIKSYNFKNEKDYVTKVTYQSKINPNLNTSSALAYAINIKLSDKKVVNALLPYNKAREFVTVVPDIKYVKELSEEINKDLDNFISYTKKVKSKHIPSIVCFGVSALAIMFALIIVLGYQSTNGTYYASKLAEKYPRMPINTYSYSVENISYTGQEDYTISFGGNKGADVTVFYRASNPSDSYSMYTIDFLIFIALTMFVIGGILLNTTFSPHLAVFGLSIMPFYLIKLLNVGVSTLLTTQFLIPFLSLLALPVYLLFSGVLKIATDIYKISKEKELQSIE